MNFEPDGSWTSLTESQQRVARLKFEILAEGVKVTANASRILFDDAWPKVSKKPLRTRSGVSGGLDLRLVPDVFVNAPVAERFATSSRILLEWQNSGFYILRGTDEPWKVEPLPEPAFYSLRSRDGSEALQRVAQMCSPDRLCYGMTGPACVFWAPGDRCQFCSIGLNSTSDASKKREEHFYEAIDSAASEVDWPARHILLGGGTPPGRDMGAIMAARLCEGVKRRLNISIYVMIVAPLDDKYIDMLFDAGVDELGMNLEFWSATAWDRFIPGKRDRVGKARYLAALSYAQKRFGPIRTRSILIAGLEPPTETVSAVTALSEAGVMPIISPFRPLDGTELQATRGFSAEQYVDLYDQCSTVVRKTNLPLGPVCICCQNNILALPFGQQYRRY